MKTCKYVVIRKKRNCRLIVVDEKSDFCPEHQLLADGPKTDVIHKRRVACPLDGKHSCYEDKLEKHLKICNAKPKSNVPYVEFGVNSDAQVNKEEGLKLREVSRFEMEELIATIEDIHKKLKLYETITQKTCNHKLPDEKLEKNPNFSSTTAKHIIQSSALLGILSDYKILQSDTCYVEFGAGRGQFSYWLHEAVNSLPNLSVLLVERSSQRHKFDNKIPDKGDRVQRIRVDISDLVLKNVDIVARSKRVFGVSKHLCGMATDLAMKCLMNCEKDVSGLLMAFCCHHRCEWSNYVGKQFFEEVGLNQRAFAVMTRMSSWATCGLGRKGNSNDESEVNEEFIQMTKEEKTELGKKCKNIIDYGRLRYLEEQGFQCYLHYYVDLSVTLENVCIVAIKKV